MTGNVFGLVVGSKVGTSVKTGRPYQVVDIIIQDENLNCSLLKHFVPEQDQGLTTWFELFPGVGLELELKETVKGMTTYTNVASARRTSSAPRIIFDD